MKKYIALAAAALLCGFGASAQKTADQLRIYVNPGHGSWTANDRPMNTLYEGEDGKPHIRDPKSGENRPDTTAFYETNTNLVKCLALVQKLEEYGLKLDRTLNQVNSNPYRVGAALDLRNNIVMSRTKSGPWPKDDGYDKEVCNRALSEFAYEAHTNNFDMFISVHSNAHSADNGNTNYLVLIYRGTNGEGGDRSPGSREMCRQTFQYPFSISHHHWTHRLTNDDGAGVIGDVTFYHDEYYSSKTGCSGYLGALRHAVPGYLVEGYFHTYQPSRARAMNWEADRVEGYMYARGAADYFGLDKEKTGDIYGIVRDKRARFTHDIYHALNNTTDVYKPINSCTVILKKDGQEVRRTVTDKHYNGSFVFRDLEPGEYTVSFEHPWYYDADEDQPTKLTIEPAKTVFPEVFLSSSRYNPPEGDFYDYPDPYAGAEQEVNSFCPKSELYSDVEIPELAGRVVKRTLARDKMIYILSHDADMKPAIILYDSEACKTVRSLSTAGAQGEFSAIGDIALSSEGRLMAMNAGSQERGAAFSVIGYRWPVGEDGYADGEPEEVLITDATGEYENAEYGKAMAFSGLSGEGKMYYPAMTAADTHRLRLTVLDFVEGFFSEAIYNNLERLKFNGSAISDTGLGDYDIMVSPLHDNSLIFMPQNGAPFEITCKDANGNVPTLVASANKDVIGSAVGGTIFKIADNSILAVYDDNAKGVVFYNITNGLDKAEVCAPDSQKSAPAKSPSWTGSAAAPHVNAWAAKENEGAWDPIIYATTISDGKISKTSYERQVGAVEGINADNYAPVEYFNLQGIRVDNPAEGQIVIRRQGTNATKVLVK